MLDKKLDYNYVDLHENIWVAAIMMKGGYKKVPLIIYQTEVVGGYTELEEYYKGKTYG
jgi:glutaredoxin